MMKYKTKTKTTPIYEAIKGPKAVFIYWFSFDFRVKFS